MPAAALVEAFATALATGNAPFARRRRVRDGRKAGRTVVARCADETTTADAHPSSLKATNMTPTPETKEKGATVSEQIGIQVKGGAVRLDPVFEKGLVSTD